MSIHKNFDSPNNSLQELDNLIKYDHPNLKSKKIKIISSDEDVVYFQLIRDIEIPVSDSLLKRLFMMNSNVITLSTNVKFYNRLQKVEMITSVPKRFEEYVSGEEKIIITNNQLGCNVDISLSYKVNKSSVIISPMISMVESIIIKKYTDRRLLQFGNVSNKKVKSISDILGQ